MPILTSTLLFYVVAGIVLALALRFLRQGGSPARAILGTVPAVAVTALLLAAGFGEGSFGAMRLAGHGLFGLLPTSLVLAGVSELHGSRRASALGAAVAIWALALWAFAIEPRRLEVSVHRIETGQVSRPHRIVVLADLQTDRVGEYEAEVLDRIAALRPDLLLLTGDYVQTLDTSGYLRETRALREAWSLSGIGPPLGAFAVEGNTDWPDLWPGSFEGTGVRTLSDTTTFPAGELGVTALSLVDSGDPGFRLAGNPSFQVVFGHRPDYALGAVDAELLLAGHTHGGQVRLPGLGPLLTLSRVPRAWAAGRTSLSDGRTLVVSRGVGMERGYAPRLRFLCRPELVVVDVVPSEVQGARYKEQGERER